MDDIEIRLKIVEIWEKMKNFYITILGMLFAAISFSVVQFIRSPIVIRPSIIFLFLLSILLLIIIIINYFLGAYKNIAICLATLEITENDINKLIQWRGAVSINIIINFFLIILSFIIQYLDFFQPFILMELNDNTLKIIKNIILIILIVNTTMVIVDLIKDIYDLFELLKKLRKQVIGIKKTVDKINKNIK